MKIDPNIQFPNDPQSDRVSNANSPAKAAPSQRSASGSGVSSANGEDTFSLSTAHAEIQTLAANLANVPDVRTPRVVALQQRVQNGNYHPDSSKVADALLAEQTGRKQ